MMERIAVGMSGGTDSSAAAYLLKRAGYDPVGILLRLSGEEDVASAERVCNAIGMELHVADIRQIFRARVIEPFLETYRIGMTPNPCVFCNREIKFGEMLRIAEQLGCQKLATGHYARSIYRDGVWHLCKGKDEKKDQSYFLWMLKTDVLSRVIFPLGELSKEDARSILREANIPAQQHESQDICFIPDGKCDAFLRLHGVSGADGNFVDRNGRILGVHHGLGSYTIGQRKGLGISAAEPLYVLGKNAGKNEVILGGEEELYRQSVYVKKVQWVSGKCPEPPFRCSAKLRYTRQDYPCSVHLCGEEIAELHFDAPVRAPAPGQSAVLYCGEEVLGGGFIAERGIEPTAKKCIYN